MIRLAADGISLRWLSASVTVPWRRHLLRGEPSGHPAMLYLGDNAFIDWFIHSLYSFIHSFIHLLYSFIHPFIHHSSIHFFFHSLFLSFVHSFIHSFIHPVDIPLCYILETAPDKCGSQIAFHSYPGPIILVHIKSAFIFPMGPDRYGCSVYACSYFMMQLDRCWQWRCVLIAL